MNCTKCTSKNCRKLETCKLQSIDKKSIIEAYHINENQAIVQAAANLVDNGRAGTLNRLQEIIAFAKEMNYKKIGLAYCYGMEIEASIIQNLIKNEGINVIAVSCTVGGMPQNDINKSSSINKVSCNPLSQASQMNSEGVDFAVMIGLCLGHDVLFQKYIHADVTTLVVKDRVLNHAPLDCVKK